MLEEIKQRLNTQDNRATKDPIFIVYDWEKIPSHRDYTDKWEYVDAEDGDIIGDTKKELVKYVEDNIHHFPKNISELSGDEFVEWLESKGYQIHKFYYLERRSFVNVFFTEKSADDYIEQNKHHFSSKIHTYVNSLWRNPEMQYIRNSLKEGKIVEKV